MKSTSWVTEFPYVLQVRSYYVIDDTELLLNDMAYIAAGACLQYVSHEKVKLYCYEVVERAERMTTTS